MHASSEVGGSVSADTLEHLGFKLGVLTPNNVDVRDGPTPTLSDGMYRDLFHITSRVDIVVRCLSKTDGASDPTDEDTPKTS